MISIHRGQDPSEAPFKNDYALVNPSTGLRNAVPLASEDDASYDKVGESDKGGNDG